MLTIHYFASVREALDKNQEQIELPASVTKVGELIDHLAANNPDSRELFESENKLLVAVNQTVVDRDFALSDNDEVAFFPPMTGG